MNSLIYNALTVDVEDWYHICGIGDQATLSSDLCRVGKNVDKILALLDRYQCKATFFILGAVAESNPALASLIASRGHEIASHGYSHKLLTEMNEQQFREELLMTERILIDQTGNRPFGFRAPQWSVSSNTPWVDQVLAEYGYMYDSSRSPLPFTGDISLPRHPYKIATPNGSLWEIPPMVTPFCCTNLPTGGGWGLRLFPLTMITSTIERYQSEKIPAVLYLHPREVDPDGPRLRLSPLKYFVSYGARSDAMPRISALLERFRFSTLLDMVTNGALHSDTSL